MQDVDCKEFVPYSYQEKELQAMLEASSSFGCYGLGLYPGLGKTAIALKKVYNERKPTLVIAPLQIMYTTWISEPKKWCFSKNLKITVLHGPKKEKALFDKAGIYLINPEGVLWLEQALKKHYKGKPFPWHTLIVDESVTFKNPKSKRFKALKKLLPYFKHRHILTGNPVPTAYTDLWSQIYILDQGKRLGHSFYSFQNRYFYPEDYRRFSWKLKDGAEEEILSKISDIFSVITLEEAALELPERVIRVKKIELPPDVRKKYNTMEKKMFAEIDEYGTKVLAKTKSTALISCAQLANGFVYKTDKYLDDEGQEKQVRHTIKFSDFKGELVSSLVEELDGNPCVITYHFNEDLRRLKERFGSKAVYLDTETKAHEIAKIEKDWNAGKISILISHINKVARGLNLQNTPLPVTIILYSLTYNYDVFDQLCYRFQRQGSKHRIVMVIMIVAEDTVNEAAIKALEKREDLKNGFFEALLEYKRAKENMTITS